MPLCKKGTSKLFCALMYLTLGVVTTRVLDKSCDDLSKPPEGVDEKLWAALQPPSDKNEYAGKTLGLLERAVAFISGYQGVEGYVLLGGYLAFKLGSKWPVWQHVFHYPASLVDEKIDSLQYMKATRLWGGIALMRFLIGTTTNVLLGIVLGHVVHCFWLK
jgi:hypothetical protein